MTSHSYRPLGMQPMGTYLPSCHPARVLKCSQCSLALVHIPLVLSCHPGQPHMCPGRHTGGSCTAVLWTKLQERKAHMMDLQGAVTGTIL